MARRALDDADAGALDALELVTGPFVRAVSGLSGETLVPGKPPARRGWPRRGRMLVPGPYFPDGRDRSMPVGKALSFGHRNDVPELCLRLDGTPVLVVEGTVYELAPGDLGLLMPGVLHFETSGHRRRPYRMLWVILGPGVASIHVTEYRPGRGYSVRARAVLGAMAPAIEDATRAWRGRGRSRGGVLALRTALLSLAARAARFLSGGSFAAPDDVSRAVRRARDFVRSRYTERISVADVAQAAGLSPNYLSTVFREATGRTVLESVHELKLAEAKARLRETSDPVKRVALELGFESPHYFSRFFRRATGSTPSAFRAGRP